VLLHHLLKLSKAQEKLLLQDIEHQSIRDTHKSWASRRLDMLLFA
jgi:hypothetical protein